MKKQYNISDIYLLCVIRHYFYVPMHETECYFNYDIDIEREYYVLALKKENETYIDINSLKKFKERQIIGFGYIDYVVNITSLKDIINNEDFLKNEKVTNVFNNIMIDNGNKVLKRKKKNRW